MLQTLNLGLKNGPLVTKIANKNSKFQHSNTIITLFGFKSENTIKMSSSIIEFDFTKEKSMENEEEFDQDDILMQQVEKLKWSCDRIRKKINEFLATKEMTQTLFLSTIHCNSNSCGRFMKLKGSWNGTQNGCYWGAVK